MIRHPFVICSNFTFICGGYFVIFYILFLEARMDNHKFTVSARVLPLATRAEYEDLKENTRDKNAYSHLNTEQN